MQRKHIERAKKAAPNRAFLAAPPVVNHIVPFWNNNKLRSPENMSVNRQSAATVSTNA
jgi:hypothetical protein